MLLRNPALNRPTLCPLNLGASLALLLSLLSLLSLLLGAAPGRAQVPASLPLPHGVTTLWARGGHIYGPRVVAFSADRQLLASGGAGSDTTVKLHREADGVLLHTLLGHTGSINALAFAPDAQTLASGSGDKTVKLWRVADGSLLRTIAGTQAVNALAFSPDGQKLALGGADNSVRLVNVATGATLVSISVGSNVRTLAFAPDGQTLAAGSEDKLIRLYNPATGALTQTLTGHTAEIHVVQFAPDSKTLASGAGNAYNETNHFDNYARLWNVATGAQVQTFNTGVGIVRTLDFAADSKTLLTNDAYNSVSLWRVSDGQRLHNFASNANSAPLALAYLPGDQSLAYVGSSLGTIVLDAATGSQISRLTATYNQYIQIVQYAPNGQNVVTSDGFRVQFWGRYDTQPGWAYYQASRVNALAIAPDSQTVAFGNYFGPISIWQPNSITPLVTMNYNGNLNALAYSPNGQILAAAGANGITLFRASDGGFIETLNDTNTSGIIYNCVAFSPDGQTLAAGSGDFSGNDPAVRWWRVSDGQLLGRKYAHASAVRTVAFSPDGSLLASGGADNLALLWNVATQTVALSYPRNGSVSGVAFSSNGKALGIGSQDGTILFVNPLTGRLIVSDTLETRTGVTAFAFAPDNTDFLFGRSDAAFVLGHLDPTPILSKSVSPTLK